MVVIVFSYLLSTNECVLDLTVNAKYFENVSRIKSLSSVILDSVDSELTCI